MGKVARVGLAGLGLGWLAVLSSLKLRLALSLSFCLLLLDSGSEIFSCAYVLIIF